MKTKLVPRERPKNKTWEYPKGSGIKIAEMPNKTGGLSFGVSYQVRIRGKLLGVVNKREMFQRGTNAEAERIAEDRLVALKKHGTEFSATDGRYYYHYDAENRPNFIRTSVPAGVAIGQFDGWTFTYDYLGRRASKIHYIWNGSGWAFQSEERYIYNGWNLIAVLDGSLAITKNFFWGLDLSGTEQGAGGVGGLLMTQDGGNNYLPLYDAMGNVHGLIKASDGSIAAAYEYDAFGNTLRESGTYAANNPFRYSTKYTDIETGLIYYGQRYYSPSLGRFINKDPIEEAGGLNLYGFCGNNGVNEYDYLGLSWFSDAIKGVRHFLGQVDNFLAKNHIQGDGSVSFGYSTPIAPANPGGQIVRTGANPFPAGSGNGAGGGSGGGTSGGASGSQSNPLPTNTTGSPDYSYVTASAGLTPGGIPGVRPTLTWDGFDSPDKWALANMVSGGLYSLVFYPKYRAIVSVSENTDPLTAAMTVINPGYQILNGLNTAWSGTSIGTGAGIDHVGIGGRILGGAEAIGGAATAAGMFAPFLQAEQYALLARQDGFYPVMKFGEKDAVGGVWLKRGEVWKYGETINPLKRYPRIFYQRIGQGLEYERQFRGSKTAARMSEFYKILEYWDKYQKLPPGNKARH